MIRQKPFRIGDTVRIHDSVLHEGGCAYPLPDGLKDGVR